MVFRGKRDSSIEAEIFLEYFVSYNLLSFPLSFPSAWSTEKAQLDGKWLGNRV